MPGTPYKNEIPKLGGFRFCKYVLRLGQGVFALGNPAEGIRQYGGGTVIQCC